MSSSPSRLPASFVQEQFFASATNGLSQTNLAIALRFNGPLDRGALLAALGQLAMRHETLRTTLALSGSSLEQVIWPARNIPLAEFDVSRVKSPHDELQTTLMRELDRPCDLVRGELIRGALVRLGNTEHVLALIATHAVADAWSTRILSRDIVRLYAAAVGCEPSRREPLALQYGDYAAWERGFEDRSLEQYWRDNLTGRRRARLPIGTRPSGTVVRKLDPLPPLSEALTRRLWELGRAHHVSPALTLAALVACAMSKYGTGEITIGVILGNRARSDLQPIVGCLSDFVPVRIPFGQAPTFVDVLTTVRDVGRAAISHYLPYGRIHTALGNTGLWSDSGLFDVGLNYLPTSSRRLARTLYAGGEQVTISEVPIAAETQRYTMNPYPMNSVWLDYNLTTAEDGGLCGNLATDGASFAPEAISELAVSFLQAVLAAVTDPVRPVDSSAAR